VYGRAGSGFTVTATVVLTPVVSLATGVLTVVVLAPVVVSATGWVVVTVVGVVAPLFDPVEELQAATENAAAARSRTFRMRARYLEGCRLVA
jgi:hypothetical protein